MKEWIKKYRALDFKERTISNAKISIIFNGLLAIGKIVLCFFSGIFLLVSSIVNILIMLSKLECYLGVKYPDKRSFKFRNNLISLFIISAGIQYGIYMSRLLFTDVPTMDYDMFMGLIIASISFIELAVAIKGCFNATGKGHYYRNIKLTSLCSAFTAIVLTEVAILSFAGGEGVDYRILNGCMGAGVGLLIVIIGIYVFFAPKISIVDKEYNVYQIISGEPIKEDVNIKLTNSKFYANYYYDGKVVEDKIEGHIIKGKNPIFSWNIYILILVMILSEILIFPYAVGSFICYLKSSKIIKELDKQMKLLNYEKMM